MARPRSGRRRKGGSGPQAGLQVHEVNEALQIRVHLLEERLGLFPRHGLFSEDSRFRGVAIPPRDTALPESMGRLFGEELAWLERMGSPAERCHHLQTQGYDLYCLGFFTYDGYKALVVVEQEGEVLAAWKEEEAAAERSPQTVLSNGDEQRLLTLFDQVLGGAA